jgi:hypothetical protein
MSPKRILPAILAVLLAASTCLAAEPIGVNIRDHGAKGDGRTDDTAAIQEALKRLKKPRNRYGWSESGGLIWFPDGHYCVDGTIDIPCEGIRIEGTGNQSIQSRNCWVDYRGAAALFRFPSDVRTVNGFSISDILLVGRTKPGSVAFELWTGLRFRSKLLWRDMGVTRFDTALVIRRESGSQSHVGTMEMRRCNWSVNRQAIVFEGRVTSCNRLTIANCTMRQNRPRPDTPPQPALDIRAYGATIIDNVLEGQPWAILLRGGSHYDVKRNYFESNKQIAVRAVGCSDVTVEKNFKNRPVHFEGKLQFTNVTNLVLREPVQTVTLQNCRNVELPGMGTWLGVVSTEEKK